MQTDPFEKKRYQMVKNQLERRDIRDPKVISVCLDVPRHHFVSEEFQADSYEDYPLDIGENQTISQPYIVALMTQALQLNGTERVLEIGTGSGYQTAILSRLAAEVVTIERIESLSQKAQIPLKDYPNITFCFGDGTLGVPQYAPYQGILVTAAAPEIPKELIEQLDEGGKIVIPVGKPHIQDLLFGIKQCGKLEVSTICGCRFVPLIGKSGWNF